MTLEVEQFVGGAIAVIAGRVVLYRSYCPVADALGGPSPDLFSCRRVG